MSSSHICIPTFLAMKCRAALPPPGTFVKKDVYVRKRWRRVQFLDDKFWNRCKKEFMHNLNYRQKWASTRRNLQIDDIVIMCSDLPRNEWQLARVIETTVDKDGLIRRVRIRLSDKQLHSQGRRVSNISIVERPIQKLVLLLEGK